MECYKPFAVKRIGPRGKNTSKHMFCIAALPNPELARTGESPKEPVLINGAMGSNPAATSASMQRLCDELNAVWARYIQGEFAER